VGEEGIGVAPGAQWIAVRVLDTQGYGYDSWIHEGFQWLLSPDGDPARAPDVVNCSWGNSNGYMTTFQSDLEALQAAGIFAVFANGNDGPDEGTVGSPASLPEAFAVGASDPYDEVAYFSSRGPSPWGEIRPHVVAPGVKVLSSLPGGVYGEMSGTSMAAPHVAGTVALLRSVSPTLSVARAAYVVTSTALSLGSYTPNNDTGWGRVDTFAAVVALAHPGFITGTVTRAGGGAPVAVAPPTAFDTAFFRVEQLVMNDRAMSLASRVDLNTHSYTMPLPDFDQQEQEIPLLASAASQSVVLTGFRAGEVKKLQIWLTRDSDETGGDAVAPQNPGKWYIPSSIQALYAGVVYAQYEDGESAMWNLLDGTAPAAADYSVLTRPGLGAAISSEDYLQQWVELPFSQPTGNDYDGEVLVHGKEITNGIVNLQVTAPAPTSASDTYTLHVAYVYNASVSFSRGSADLIF